VSAQARVVKQVDIRTCRKTVEQESSSLSNGEGEESGTVPRSDGEGKRTNNLIRLIEIIEGQIFHPTIEKKEAGWEESMKEAGIEKEGGRTQVLSTI